MERCKLGEVEESFVLLVLSVLLKPQLSSLNKGGCVDNVQEYAILSLLAAFFFLGWGSASESLLTTVTAGTQPLADADSCIYTKPSPPAAARIFSSAHISSQHVELISELL